MNVSLASRVAGAAGRLARNVIAPSAPAAQPALVRITTAVYHLRHIGKRRGMYRKLHRNDVRTFQPVGPCRLLREPLPPRIADALVDATLVMGAVNLMGIGHRVTGPVHAALQTWVLSYRNSWGIVYHHENNLVLHTMALAAGPAADAMSVDALIRDRSMMPRRRSPLYGATVQLMNAAVCSTYLIAGLAKTAENGRLDVLRGLRWADGEGLRGQVATDGIRKVVFGTKAAPLGLALLPHRTLFTALALMSLLVELAAPAALLHRRSGYVFSVLAFGMHWGIRLVMGIKFPYNLSGLLYVPFLVRALEAPRR